MKHVLLLLSFIWPGFLSAQKADSALAARVKDSGSFLYSRTKAYGIKLSLNSIYLHGQQLYFSFNITNYTKLDYPVDFIHLFMRDKITARRTTFQDRELTPIYMDTFSVVPANATRNFVIAVSQFTIPPAKELVLELFELNGGRNLRLKLMNKEIFRARRL